ncbi:Gfo/Idh/MocA family protein [Paenibacillus pseudetheri]|uniref:Inositol 2-dehydrogenase/D-chiro-inositol 3-dehydrogenase n=1 Tax=Paenibacillus pseudetheri TaxID=2897682 RepID=A0ABN8FK13_9BACL|nr:Gfo/Idh/MocA family oxidoreductase [Paenibacillus pseudetheri]CAH1057512.1 Inositol 2-dehydrogenase/D-chiro-inositol 3-dehydrogenase [Paenibacillus pseudetheri]
MNKLGVAIIGCGAISPLHAKAISVIKDVNLLTVVDIDADKATRAGIEYACHATDDYMEILNDNRINVVHLCTPHYLHAEMAVELLRAGKHVLTEKPIAADLSSAKRMLEEAQESTGQLGVVFQNRYNDASIYMKKTIDSGALGKLLCMKGIVTWHRNESYYKDSNWRGRWSTEGGGVLINQTIHTLDLLQWYGGEIKSVKGSITTDVLDGVIEVEDTAHACIDFENNVRGLFYGTNTYLENSPVELELVFEEGTLNLRRDYLYLWKDGKESLVCEPIFRATEGKSYWGTGHKRLIEDFYDHIFSGRKFWLDGTEGIKALKLVKDIYSSSQRAK